MSTIDPPLPTGPPEENDQHRRRAGRIAVVTAIVLLLSALVTAATTGPGLTAYRWLTAPSATITSPADVAVPHVFPLFGVYDDLPEGAEVWAVSLDTTTNRYYPQDKPCTVDQADFNCGLYYVGSDNGRGERIKILIVTAEAQASSAFGQYQIDKNGPTSTANPGLPALPAGAALIGSKLVVRV